MKTNNNPKENAIYVSFHIGRGGHFNNAGHLSFVREENFQQLIKRCGNVSFIFCEDAEGETLPDSMWYLEDLGGNIILNGREAIEAMTGCLDWDGDYNTDYVTTTDNLTSAEIDAIYKAYTTQEYMSDGLKDTICSLINKKRAHRIKVYPTNITVFIQDGGSIDIDTDQMAGEYTREEWADDLTQQGFCPISVEKILNDMEDYCGTNDTDFFAD